MEKSQYKEVKNLIHNELGISKDDIRLLIKEEVKKQISSYVNDEDYMKDLIRKECVNVFNSEFRSPQWKGLCNIDNPIFNMVSNEISAMVKEKVKLSLTDDTLGE